MNRVVLTLVFALTFFGLSIQQVPPPTIQFLIRAPIIDEFRQKALPQLISAMGDVEIPAIENSDLKVTNIVSSNLQLDTSSMKIDFQAPNFVALTINNVGMDLKADYEAGISFLKTRGSVAAKLSNSVLQARIEIFLRADTNKFNIRFSDIEMNVGSLNIQLSGDLLAKIANLLKGLFSGLIKSEVQKQTVKALTGVVTDQLNEYLDSAPTLIPIADTPFSLNYRPISSPSMNSKELVFSINAFLYETTKGHSSPPIDSPRPLPTIPEDAEDVYLTISEYIFDSIAFSIFDSGFLKLNITNSKIPKEIPLSLTTKLFSGLFEGIDKLYPDEKNMSLTCYPYQKPNIDLNDKNLTAEVYGACDFLIEGGEKLASLEVGITTSLNLYIENNTIKGKFIGGGCKTVKILSSKLAGDVDGIRGLLDLGLKLGLPTIGKMFLKKGFPLPGIPGVQISNTRLAFEKGAVVVQTDPDFTKMDEKTKQILVEMTKASLQKFVKDLYKRMFPTRMFFA